jgi:hypothetical protein
MIIKASNFAMARHTRESKFYLLGCWHNAYRSADKEYFWAGPFDTRKEALEMGKLKQKRGQPKTFIDWIKGTNRVFDGKESFVKNALKAGIRPALD